jgi:hypothetical protein
MRTLATLTLSSAVVAAVGGLVYWAARGGTHATRAVAYGLWFAAAALLVAMVLGGLSFVWRGLPITPPEGWVFLSAACALTVIGVAIDAAGN